MSSAGMSSVRSACSPCLRACTRARRTRSSASPSCRDCVSCCRARRENHVRKTTAQRTRVTRDGGQALVEFALVLPVLMIATFAILLTAEVGVARLSLQHATAEAARACAPERSRRAGEAAAEAATTAVADAYAAALREAVAKKRVMDIGRVIGSAATNDAARAAAAEASAANGGSAIDDVTLRCADRRVEVTILSSGASYRAGFLAGECSRR